MISQVGCCLLGILFLVIVLKLIALPMKLITRFIINSIVGIAILYMLSFFGIKLVLAWWGYLIVGVCGIPGLIFVAILSFIL